MAPWTPPSRRRRTPEPKPGARPALRGFAFAQGIAGVETRGVGPPLVMLLIPRPTAQRRAHMETLKASDESRDIAIDVLFGKVAALNACVEALISRSLLSQPESADLLRATIQLHLAMGRQTLAQESTDCVRQFDGSAAQVLQLFDIQP